MKHEVVVDEFDRRVVHRDEARRQRGASVSATGKAAVPFLGTWTLPLAAEFVTRSEVTH